MKSSVKVNLNDKASGELKQIARSLNIPESEVLRRGMAIMRVYAKAVKSSNNAKLILIDEAAGINKELIIIKN